MNETKQVVLKIGTKGWFETNFNGADVFQIIQDTIVTVQQMGGNRYWYRTIGKVDGFPENHPDLLISYKYID